MEQDRLQVIAERIEKLLRLTTSPNEHEASLAASKVQELLERYNLDMLTVNEAARKADNRRDDRKMDGGLYKWQRDIWGNVAKLNFCMYWSIKGMTKGSKFEHRVLGSVTNVLATRLMAEYLQQAIERITREQYNNDPKVYFAKPAVAYREGMAARISERLNERRYQIKEEAEKRKAESEARGDDKALTILDVEDAEYHANRDHMYGWEPGTSARRAAEEKAEMAKQRAEWVAEAERKRLAEEAFQRDFPEEWAKQEAERKAREAKENAEWEKKWRRRKGRYSKGWEPRHRDYYSGYEKGSSVSLEKQVDRTERKKIGGC